MEFLLVLIYIIVIGAVLFCMATLLLRAEKSKSSRTYLVCQGMVVLWCTSQILQIIAATPAQLTASYLIGNIGICFISSSWFYFCLQYSGKQLPKLFRPVPLLLSVFHYVMVLTNGLHHRYYISFTSERIEHGMFFYTNVCCTYLMVLAGSYILYRSMGREKPVARPLVIASVLIPVLLNAIYLSGFINPSFDITPLGFALSVVLVTLATNKYQFIDLKRELDITTEKLLLEKERNRIAQQVHDTAGHTLTMIQSYMKLAEIASSKGNTEEVNRYLTEARTLTGQGIRELRESINQLRQEARYELVTQGVMQLAGQVREIPVEVTVKGEDSERYSHLSKPIYDTVRESITNTLKYAGATKMDIVIRFQASNVEVLIADNGVGCESINANNGIRGIRERIEQAGGSVRFSTSPGEGFLTRFQLPVSR